MRANASLENMILITLFLLLDMVLRAVIIGL